jgi:hypothetical protein
MSLAKELEKLKYDKRTTEWHIRTGKMTQDELNKHLQSLPDSADNVDNLSLGAANDDHDEMNGSSPSQQ